MAKSRVAKQLAFMRNHDWTMTKRLQNHIRKFQVVQGVMAAPFGVRNPTDIL